MLFSTIRPQSQYLAHISMNTRPFCEIKADSCRVQLRNSGVYFIVAIHAVLMEEVEVWYFSVAGLRMTSTYPILMVLISFCSTHLLVSESFITLALQYFDVVPVHLQLVMMWCTVRAFKFQILEVFLILFLKLHILVATYNVQKRSH